jgi:hypothetical protein
MGEPLDAWREVFSLMHGPGPSSRDPSYQTPTWPEYPWVRVLDTIAPTLRWVRRRRWRLMRREAYDRWAPVGILFTTIERHAADYPALNPFAGDAGLAIPMVPPFLRLMGMPAPYGGTIIAVAETNQPRWSTEPGAFAAFHMPSMKVLPNDYQTNIITHEIGHCLGLDHRWQTEDARSVMKSSAFSHPDAHDIASLVDYYKGVTQDA